MHLNSNSITSTVYNAKYAKIFFLVISLLLTSCSEEKVEFDTPAEKHIQEYTNKKKFCKEATEDASEEAENEEEDLNSTANSTTNNTSTDNNSNDQDIDGSTDNSFKEAIVDIPKPDNEDLHAQNSENQSHENQKHETPKHEKDKEENIWGIMPYDIVFGNPESKIVFIEYSSPTCHHCSSYHANTFPKIKEKYIDTGKILYIIRIFVGNKQDLDAGALMMCEPKMAKTFLDIIYERQDAWMFSKSYREILTNMGQLAGISPEKYSKCLNDENLINLMIEKTKAPFEKFENIIGTPLFIINGELFEKLHTIDNFEEKINSLLKEQKPENKSNNTDKTNS